ncbi:hypothetical protein Lalb_Chr24g0401231 [Lupinus albus]|uniref:Uncharacterized protein n=1 Tax=Lupinus albus TaxID=3870 RepID=A0A6A4N0Z3_LUPAL|nr:hypothetical protein Lalb_Chr24g0401231 [Lupinus albus]
MWTYSPQRRALASMSNFVAPCRQMQTSCCFALHNKPKPFSTALIICGRSQRRDHTPSLRANPVSTHVMLQRSFLISQYTLDTQTSLFTHALT